MALNKNRLKSDIKGILDDMLTREQNTNDEFATRLADALDVYVKSAQVNAGIPVATTGTATAQTGSTTGPGQLS